MQCNTSLLMATIFVNNDARLILLRKHDREEEELNA